MPFQSPGKPPVIGYDQYLLVKSRADGSMQSIPAWHIRDGGVPKGWDVVLDTLHTRSEGVEPMLDNGIGNPTNPYGDQYNTP